MLTVAKSSMWRTPANPDISVELWAKEPMLKNTVAISHDNKGGIYATEANRRKSTDLDSRNMRGLEPLPWPVIDYSIQSVAQRREVLREYLAPTTSLSHPWLKDFNKDGARNWHDLKEKSERLHFLQDTDSNGVADKASVFAEGFNTEVTGTAAGVLWHNNKVYFTVIPDLWLLEDLDNDGIADERRSLITGHGVHISIGGHDLHGLTVGPDGRIYWSVGDKGANITSLEGRQFSYPNQGLVMRSEPDGSNFEVFAHGLRNCMELAFDDFGNLFCVDNDGDFKGERERMVYVTRHSDTGWRINWQYNMTNKWAEDNGLPTYNPWLAERLHVPYFEGQAAYITPALENYSDGPAGFTRNPGTALSYAYKDYFFVTQFPGQKITAFQLRPKGAAFEMANEQHFQSGFMATGMSFGPDGALYVADWGGNWEPTEKGGIFKLDVKSDPHPLREQTAELLAAGFAQLTVDSLVALLNYPDQRVRQGAQFALVEHNQQDALHRTVFDTSTPQFARVHGIWGLGQLARANTLTQRIAIDRLLADTNPQVRIQACRLIQEAPALFAEFESSLVQSLQDENLQVRFHAAQALGSVGTTASAPALFEALRNTAGKDPFIRHSIATALTGINDVQSLLNVKDDPSNSVRTTAVVALRRMKSPVITTFLTDADPLVVLETARAIHDDFGIPEAMPALAALLNNTPHADNEPLMRRVLNANYRLGKQKHAAAVLDFFMSGVASSDLQKEALAMLQHWTNPPVLDRVERRYRVLDSRDPGEISSLLNAQLATLLQRNSDNAIIKLLRQYNVSLDPELLQNRLADESRAISERTEILALLINQTRQARQAYRTAFESASTTLRQEALALMAESDQKEAVKRIEKILGNQSGVQERQHALTTLAGIETRSAKKLANRLLQNLRTGKIRPEEQLEVFFLGQAHSIAVDDLETEEGAGEEAPFAYSMAGGDVLAGQKIFNEHPVAQCIRCHAVTEGEGSAVGPNLSGAGSTHSSSYLMEALVTPSIILADGFDNAAGISAMPPMGQILSAKELRDVMAYLGSL
ncbi:MAG: PVC-type heme-binding CxxCH protein [Bacteroidota bacterium]